MNPDFIPPAAAGPDVAYTPAHVARAVVDVLAPELAGLRIWEPCVGGGAFADALAPLASELLVSDIDPQAHGLTQRYPKPTRSEPHNIGWGLPHGWPRPGAIVTNPAFSKLDEHVPIMLDAARDLVALLLIGQWVAPASRDWLWDHAIPDWHIWMRERIAFEGPGRQGGTTDMREYSLVVWRRRHGSWGGRGLMGRMSTTTGRLWLGRGA